jgi:4a-hydroxytetrahydrobiopterin dehydratase
MMTPRQASLSERREEHVMSDAKEKTYTDAEIAEKITQLGLDQWYLEDGWLRRKYNTDGWPTTLMLTNAIGFVCEAAWHHADLAITWGKLWVKLKTHSAGGITDKDFALARKIEDTVLWRPEAGGPLEGTPNKFVQVKK